MKSGSDSIRHHVSRIWPTLRLGVVTTIIAYAALAFSELDGLSQLGFFTVSGLLTAAAVTRWILPVIAPNWMRISHRARRLHRIIERVGRNAYRVKPVTVLVVFAALITLVVNQDRLLDTSVDSLSPLPVDRRLDEHVVRNQIGVWTGGKLMVATGPTAQSVLELQEDLETNLNGLVSSSVISGFDMAANFLPSVALQKQRQSQLPTDQELEDRVSEAIEGLPFKSGIFDPFIEDISRYRSHDPVTPDAVFATSIGSRFRSLLFEFDGSWVAPILLHGVSDETQLRNLSAKQADTELVYLNLKGESNRIMASVMDHIAWVLAIGSCTIYLVLLLSFGSWLQPLRVLIPTVASILTVSALTVAFGVSLTLFHLVSLLLVMGLGLDYALFFCRLSEHEDEWGTTYRSIWICCVTTVIVFSVLATSQTPPLHTVGITVAMGAALSFLYGAIWSTAQLALGIRPGANQREISPS